MSLARLATGDSLIMLTKAGEITPGRRCSRQGWGGAPLRGGRHGSGSG